MMRQARLFVIIQYFMNAAASKSTFSVYVGNTTCVLKLSGNDVEGIANDCIYDVYGRRVINPVKGEIYIVNGEKILYWVGEI